MLNIFRQLKRHLPLCLLIIALLVVQAYCDLSLPAYTSDIVDVGIQQGGVTSAAPGSIRKETLQSLEFLMSKKDAALVEKSYGKANADGVRKLLSSADRDKVEDALTIPDVALYMTAAQTAAKRLGKTKATPAVQDLDTVNATFAKMAAAGPAAAAQMQAQMKKGLSTVSKTTMDTVKKQSVLLVKLDYKAQGIADRVQTSYLWREGRQMLGLSLLMVAVAILAGLLAARIAAGVARDLRPRRLFKRVLSFSGAEMDSLLDGLADHAHHERHHPDPDRGDDDVPHRAVRALYGRRRHHLRPAQERVAGLGAGAGGGGADLPGRDAVRGGAAQVQAPPGADRPAQPRHARKPLRHHGQPRLQRAGL
jgi:ATP-binding cassette subfamily B protein